ncbi:arylesterase [Deltaproteobacteria bacterium IMCC39524]|nr:arylesterase [Deltaproteobacteria bacterium IMCC39524]
MHLSFLLKLVLFTILTVSSSFANSTATNSVVILVLGDSLTAGYGLARDESFPRQLENSLATSGYPVTVINAGVSGDTSAGGLARLEWALAVNPQVVLVELGANDALRGLDPTQTYDNLDQILARLKKASCRIVLAGMRAPRNLGLDYTLEFDQIYPDLAERHDLYFYPFFLDGVATDPGLNQADGIHPNAEGVRVVVKGIQPLVVKAIEEVVATKERLE